MYLLSIRHLNSVESPLKSFLPPVRLYASKSSRTAAMIFVKRIPQKKKLQNISIRVKIGEKMTVDLHEYLIAFLHNNFVPEQIMLTRNSYEKNETHFMSNISSSVSEIIRKKTRHAIQILKFRI